MKSKTTTRATRMGAEERRELVLQAATRAFAKTGFAGTSTDAIAREADVSQPYVVRIFGTKLDLFLEVYNRACARIAGAFEAVLDEGEFDPDDEDDWGRMGAAYTALLADRDFLLVTMHGYSAGAVEEIAAASRNGMASVFEVVRRTGCTDEQATEFIAHGMLLNVMIAMGAPAHVKESDALASLTVCAFGEALSAVSP